MREELVKYLYAAGISEVLRDCADLETALKELGNYMGRYFLIAKDFKREDKIELLLYKLTYFLLPSIYETKRSLEKSTTTDKTYLIVEDEPLFAKYISLQKENKDFACDSIFTGLIETVLLASGFDSDVVAHNAGTGEFPDRVVFVITLKDP